MSLGVTAGLYLGAVMLGRSESYPRRRRLARRPVRFKSQQKPPVKVWGPAVSLQVFGFNCLIHLGLNSTPPVVPEMVAAYVCGQFVMKGNKKNQKTMFDTSHRGAVTAPSTSLRSRLKGFRQVPLSNELLR